MALQSEPNDGTPADRHPTELMGTVVPARLGASFPLVLDEHLPAALFIGHLAIRHPARRRRHRPDSARAG
jgi:hypothetical protein